MVKSLPTVRETRVQSLGWKDLEKEMATHSSILAWRMPWMEEPGGLQSIGSQRIGHDGVCMHIHTHSHTLTRVIPDGTARLPGHLESV